MFIYVYILYTRKRCLFLISFNLCFSFVNTLIKSGSEERKESLPVPLASWGENVGRVISSVPAHSIVKQWMLSEDHKKHILSRNTVMAVAAVEKNNMFYFTQFFIKPMNPLPSKVRFHFCLVYTASFNNSKEPVYIYFQF